MIPKVVARLGGQERAREHDVFNSFSRVVGGPLRERTEPDALKGTTLFVRVSSSALAHQLTLLKREILDRIAAELGPELVTDLRTRVGPLRAR